MATSTGMQSELTESHLRLSDAAEEAGDLPERSMKIINWQPMLPMPKRPE